MTYRGRTRPTILILLLFLVLPGCKEVDRLQGQIDDLNKQIASMNRMVDANWQASVRAIPGERYLQLIDALHGEDETEKKAAQRFLISMGNLDEEDLASQWVVSVWAKWDGEGPLRIDAAPAAAAKNRLYVEQLVASGFKPAQTAGMEALPRPRTEDEIRSELKARGEALFSALRGPYSYRGGRPHQPNEIKVGASLLDSQGPLSYDFAQNNGGFGFQGLRYQLRQQPGALIVNGQRGRPVNVQSELNARWSGDRDKFVNLLTGVVLAPLETAPLDVQNLRFEEPWDALSNRQFLHVVISQEDWDRVGGADITVRLHKKGNVDAIHPASREYKFPRSAFTRSDHPPVADGDPELGSYYWASVTLIELPQLLNRAGYEELQEFYAAQEEFDEQRRQSSV